MSHRPLPPTLLFLVTTAVALSAAQAGPVQRFDFGPGKVAPGHVQVPSDKPFSVADGYGFEPGAAPVGIDCGTSDALRSDFVTSETPFHFTAAVPSEGNYQVTVTVGDARAATTTTIKAELRRLMVEKLATAPGEFKTATFIVNVRTPIIAARDAIAAGKVKLKAPRETVQEAWAWDQAITLEFADTRSAVCAITIQPIHVPTIFLLGDSTVCDQSAEPYNSWGQMLPRFFKPTVAIANHGESGETYRDSIARRRLDKILSVMQPGDWLIMQFGHNDQKQIAAKAGGPFTTYQEEIRQHVAATRAHGGTPVIVSPMERRGFDEHGKVRPSLKDYAEAARRVAAELDVPFIDLNALSKTFYEALGPEQSVAAFATPKGKVDNTHHNNYGSYQLAKCIVAAIRQQNLPIARHVRDDFGPYDPAHPDRLADFAVAPSAAFTNERPLGD